MCNTNRDSFFFRSFTQLYKKNELYRKLEKNNYTHTHTLLLHRQIHLIRNAMKGLIW